MSKILHFPNNKSLLHQLQEITEVFLVKDKVDNGGQLVYSIEDGFIEE